jgi:hypothetical protein
MAFTRLKLKHGYHDARVSAVGYRGRDVVLDVELCGCCNDSPGPASITFLDVRNVEAVRDALELARRTNNRNPYVDVLVGIIRGDDRAFLLDLETAGGVRVEARGFIES